MKILQNLRRHLPLIFLNLLLMLFFLAYVLGILQWRFIDRLENHAYDTRMQISIIKGQDPRIVIVDIDEKSLANEGHWPWGRDRLALLLDKLFDDYQVALVGFDVVFAEPDESSGLKILEKMAEEDFIDFPPFRKKVESIRRALDYDQVFADSISGRPVVLGFYFNSETEDTEEHTSGALPAPVLSKENFEGRNTSVPAAVGFGANLPELQKQAISGGHFNPSTDEDGIVRRVPMLYEYDGQYYESLSLSIARQILKADRIEPVFTNAVTGNYAGLEWLRVGDHVIPVDEMSQAMIPYRGRQGSFPYVSASDVIKGYAEPSILKGAVVLVGTSATGLADFRSTPVQNNFPGVEIHANLIAGILDQRIKARPAYVLGIEFITLLVIGLVITFMLPLLTPVWATIITIALLLLAQSINFIAWQYANLVLPVASSVVMILIMFLLNMSYGFFFERRKKSAISNLFGQYVPPELVDEMIDDPHSYSLEAENREMTVLFSDVRGFTTLSEGLDPKELSALMNKFLTLSTEIIHDHRGTIDKYMGDAIMAFWGAPLRDPDHARHALESGIELIKLMYSLRDNFLERGWPELRIGVGVNTGVMSVGNMGSEFRMAYTVMGDPVNSASRLEGLTKEYGVDQVLAGEDTKNAVPDFIFRYIDCVRVKGKAEPVKIFTPLGLKKDISSDELNELELYEQAIKHYLNKEWETAEKQFLDLQKIYGERKLYKLFLNRLNYFHSNPPNPNWDGVFTFDSK